MNSAANTTRETYTDAAWSKAPFTVQTNVTRADGSRYRVYERFTTEAERASWLKWA